VKILQQQKDPNAEPLADDAASLGLDLLVREKGYRRGSFNPFLLEY
jgi:FdhE protein